MRDLPRILTGMFLTLLGLVLCYSFFYIASGYANLILGIIVFIIGLVILTNKKENEIEQVKKK